MCRINNQQVHMILPETITNEIDGWRDMQKDPPQVGEEIIVEMKGRKLGTFFIKRMRPREAVEGLLRWMPSQAFYNQYFRQQAH